MLMDIWSSIVAFMSEHCGIVMFVGMILLIVAEVAQFIINSSLEEEIIDLTERVELLEKKCGVAVEYEAADSKILEDSEEE